MVSTITAIVLAGVATGTLLPTSLMAAHDDDTFTMFATIGAWLAVLGACFYIVTGG